MPGIPWTDAEIDLSFLTSKIPEFSAVHSSCSSRRKNNITKAYIARFPERFAEMEFPGLAANASKDVREIKLRDVSNTRQQRY
jgi:hypothetical protein